MSDEIKLTIRFTDIGESYFLSFSNDDIGDFELTAKKGIAEIGHYGEVKLEFVDLDNLIDYLISARDSKKDNTNEPIQLEWEVIFSDPDGYENVRTFRAKVFGGWIVRNRTILYTENDYIGESMVFIPDPEHKWGI